MRLITILLILSITACASNPPINNTHVFIKADPIPTIAVNSPVWTVEAREDNLQYILSQDQWITFMKDLNNIVTKLNKQTEVINYYEGAIDRYDEFRKTK